MSTVNSRVIAPSVGLPIRSDAVARRLHLDVQEVENLDLAHEITAQGAAELQLHGNIAFLRQTVEATAVGPFDPRHDFYLTYGPVLSPGVTEITVTAPLVDPITVPPAEYTVLTLNRPVVRLRATTPDVIGALAQTDTVVRITYQAGFGDTPEDIPPDLKAALLNHVVTVFDGIDHKGTAGLSPHTARVMARYRGVSIA